MVQRKLVRGFSMSAILVMFLSILAACSGGGNDGGSSSGSDTGEVSTAAGGKVKLQWMGWGSTDAIDNAVKALFQAYPDMADKVDIEVIVGGEGDGNVAEKLRLALAANGDIPDILMFNRMQIPEFASAGILTDVTSVYAGLKDNLFPAILDLVSYDGKQVAFPVEAKTKLWFYRKDLFDEAGIDPTNIPNVDAFIEAGKKLKAKFPDANIWNMPTNFGGYNTAMVLSGNGGKFWDNDAKTYVVDTDPGVRRAFEDFKKIKDAGITSSVADFTPDWEKAFADSTLVSTPLANWMKNFLPNYAPDQAGKWAVTQWPVIGDAVGGSENGGAVFVVPEKSKNKEAAIDLLTKLTLTKEGRLAWYETHSRIPPLVDAINDPAIQKANPYFGESLPIEEAKALEHVKVFDYTPASTLEFTIVNDYLAKYLNGQLSLDEALGKAQTDLENQIGNPFQ